MNRMVTNFMDFWIEFENKLNRYYISNCTDLLDQLLKYLEPLLSKKSHSVTREAHLKGVYIPYEDFYSNFLLSAWQAIEDYKNISDKDFKSVLGRRLYFSKCEIWRNYKKKSADARDKDGITYVSSRWERVEDHHFSSSDNCNIYCENIHLKEALLKFFQENPKGCEFISLLIQGYSSAEALIHLGLCSKYDVAARKRAQRMRSSFKEFLSVNEIEIV